MGCFIVVVFNFFSVQLLMKTQNEREMREKYVTNKRKLDALRWNLKLITKIVCLFCDQDTLEWICVQKMG